MTAALGIVALVIVVLLAVSGLFSAAETALTGASRARMHQLEKDGDKAAGRVNRLLERQGLMIGAVLLGNNLINILSGSLITDATAKSFPGGLGIAIATVVTTVLVLIFAEVLPKTLALSRPDATARTLAYPVWIVTKLFGPIIIVVQGIVGATLRLVGIKAVEDPDAAVAQEEIRGAVEYHHSEGLVEARDRRMLGGVLDLAGMSVEEVMVHRRSISVLDADLPPRELVAQALAAPHTRLPLYRGETENIVGVLHGKDLARALVALEGDIERLEIDGVMREPWFIPETTNLKDQLEAFLKTRVHFALIVDEYGALQGLVTLEDILEEIVGEIEDEHDVQVEGVRAQADGGASVDGAVSIRDLNRAMGWSLPDDEWVTVAGLVIHEAQTIPEVGQTFIFHGHRFQVQGRSRNQLTSVRVSAPLEAAAA